MISVPGPLPGWGLGGGQEGATQVPAAPLGLVLQESWAASCSPPTGLPAGGAHAQKGRNLAPATGGAAAPPRPPPAVSAGLVPPAGPCATREGPEGSAAPSAPRPPGRAKAPPGDVLPHGVPQQREGRRQQAAAAPTPVTELEDRMGPDAQPLPLPPVPSREEPCSGAVTATPALGGALPGGP